MSNHSPDKIISLTVFGVPGVAGVPGVPGVGGVAGVFGVLGVFGVFGVLGVAMMRYGVASSCHVCTDASALFVMPAAA